MRRRLPRTPSLNSKLISIAALVFGLVLLPLIGYLAPKTGAQNQPVNITSNKSTPKKNESVPGELLVRFRRGTLLAGTKSRASINIATVAGRSVRVDVDHFGGSDLVEGLMLARVASEDTRTALQALRARADVQYVEPNYIRYADVVPNDPSYSNLWGLKNSNGGISAEAAWDTTTGSHNVVVGVIDSGIDIEHRDLKDNIFVNTAEIPGNNIDDDNNGYIDDVNGWDFAHHDKTVFDSANDDAHGTHVAGTIGARGNNAAGVVGVNWDVQLLPLKALTPEGASDATLLEAYNYAKMMRQRGINLRVLNNSYGGQRFSQSLFDAVKQLGDAGILFVAAAGNDTLNNDFVPHFPATFDLPNVISVASSTQGGFFSNTFSNFGTQTVHLAAPGEDILSTTPHGYTGSGVVASLTDPDGSTYTDASGTSMATPHVSGAAALVCAANPGISLEKLRAAVIFGVDPFFNLVMTGRLNANRTLQFALENDSTPPAPAPNFHINSQDGRRVQLFWTDAGDDGMTGNASLRELYFTDAVTGEQFRLNAGRPGTAGTSTSTFVSIPYKHTSGQLSIRTTDNVGNSSTASVEITVPADVADPYIVSVGPATPLTALNSGTPLSAQGDDITRGVTLPFPFPFFGFVTTNAVISSNGALYIPIPPDFAVPNPNFGPFDFAVAGETNLRSLAMVAGMWADLRTDTTATDNVYMVQPDIDHVIFRWQGATFAANTPVNFEIELSRDGSIKTRYGTGNTDLTPVIVGISGGDREAYLVGSHSSDSAPLSLTNAQSVTFALRNPPPPPIADLSVSVTPNPDPVISGQNLSYGILVSNLGPSAADLVVVTQTLPAGTTFVSCFKDHIFATCTHSAGTVTATINTLQPKPMDFGLAFTINVKVDAAAGAALTSNVSATSFRPDPNPANNSANVTTYVVAQSFFTNARAIAAGRWHTTSVKTDGTVWSWGSGESGQLGDGNFGTGVRTFTPLQVIGLAGVDQIAESRSDFVLALKSDGTVWGWGRNASLQLGPDPSGGFGFALLQRPMQIPGLTNVKGIAAGETWSAALKHDGTVWVWGAPVNLVDTIFAFSTPLQLPAANIIAIAAGKEHLLMLAADKTVWAVGSNGRGQLGGGPPTFSTSPVQVVGISNVARIAAGQEFSLALKEDGTIWTWGHNANGQLGPNGGNMDFGAPHPNAVQVTGLPAGMTNFAAGDSFCLAIAGDGTVWSWGANNSFQLGQGTQGSQNPIPKQVPNFGSVVAVAGGEHHSVALKSDGSLWAWGLSGEGELGDGTVGSWITGTPVRVTGIETVNSPIINPAGGKFFMAVDAMISSPTSGATIRFTTNGSDPTQNDPVIASGGTIHITTNTVVRARAWKPGMVPSGVSLVAFEQGSVQDSPALFVDASGTVANPILAALDTVLLTREPFLVVNPANFLKQGNDPNTRVTIYALNLPVFAGENAASITVNLTDANGVVFNVAAEDVSPFTLAFEGRRITFRLPTNLAVGVCQVKITAHNLTSNIGTIRIAP